jgi:hypothetical protein
MAARRVSLPATSITRDSTVKSSHRHVLLALVLLLAAVQPSRGEAQMRSPQVLTLGGGVSRYDFYGTDRGSSFVFTGRFDGQIGSYVLLEAGVAYTGYNNAFGRTNWLFPEISVQAQGYVGPLRPFAGGGLGFANITHGPNISKLTLHAVSGLRVGLGAGWGLRMEARLRAIDPWISHTLDLTAGIMRVMPTAF